MENVLIIKRIFQAVTMQAKRGEGATFSSKNNGMQKSTQHLHLCLFPSLRASESQVADGGSQEHLDLVLAPP